MRKFSAALAAAAVAVAIAAAPASAGQGNAYGKNINSEFGSSYGQILNSVRDAQHPGDLDVFPPAAGAKAFYEIHSAG